VKKYKSILLYTLPPILLGILVLFGYARMRTQELPFETIEIAELPGTGHEYQGKEPSLVIVTRKGGINLLGNTVSTNSQSKLDDLDFGEYFALVVYQGIKGTDMYGAEIQHITRQKNTVNIYAHFTERDPSIGAADIVTSPYHIVKIPKQGLNGKIEFVLYSDGNEIIGQYYTMP
jgi:hypothetical protein